MVASAIYNCNRSSTDDPLISPFDFIRDEQDAENREKRRTAKKFVQQALTLPFGTTREKYLEVRLKVIEDLKVSGYEDAEQIVDGCFPSLKENR